MDRFHEKVGVSFGGPGILAWWTDCCPVHDHHSTVSPAERSCILMLLWLSDTQFNKDLPVYCCVLGLRHLTLQLCSY